MSLGSGSSIKSSLKFLQSLRPSHDIRGVEYHFSGNSYPIIYVSFPDPEHRDGYNFHPDVFF